MKYYYYLFIIFSYYLLLIKAITVRYIVYGFYVYDDLYNTILRDFNKYSKKNDLDINLEMVLFTENNITTGRDTYTSTIESYLLNQKKNKLYDLYIYDPIYTRRFSSHFINLKDYLGDDYFNNYSYDAYQVSTYNGRWVSLPIFIKYKVMFSNMIYLNKYEEKIPRTWDELIRVGERILKEERENYNNTQLVGYNGLFPDNENTICSIYEFLYSYRDKKTSPLPEFNSQIAIDALNKLNEVKEKVSSDAMFRSDEFYNMNIIMGGNILFSNMWDGMIIPGYTATPLPGKNTEVNGACLGGFNIGISKYIGADRIKASLEVIKYFTSEEIQKKLAINYNVISALTKVYDDEKVCKFVECNLAKEVQGINRPSNEFEDYEPYALKVISIFFRFLYKGESAKEILREIDDITRIYSYSFKMTSISVVMFVLLILCFLSVLLSSSILFIPKFKKYFNFMTVDLGIIYSIGSLLIISSEFTFYEDQTVKKCHIWHALVNIGYAMIFTPITYKLIINFPQANKYSKFIRKRKYLFIFSMILFEIIINLLLLISPYEINDIILESNKNFRKCALSKMGSIVTIIQIVAKILIFVLIISLIFLEWNLRNTYNDMRTLSISMSMDSVIVSLFIIFNYIKLNDYIIYHTLHICIILIFTLSNHNYMFILRIIIQAFFAGNNEEEKIIDKLLIFNNTSNITSEMLNSSATMKTNKTERTKSSSKSKSTIKSKIISLHYASTTSEKENE